MLKRFFSSLVLLSLSLGSVATFLAGSEPAQAAPMNAYIKGSAPTVYWHASNGRRYVFPNARTFQSWQSSGSASVTTIGDVELYTIPIGGNMTYRPGSRLLKITTDPKVYAVSRYGVLRWVTSESIARSLYGENWNQMVDDVPDEFFVNYTIGSPINHAADYSVSGEYNSVTTPNENISTQASVGNGTNQNNQVAFTNMHVGLTANREIVYANDSNRDVTITATVTNPSIPVDQLRIRIYDRNHGGSTPDLLLRTCEGTVTCAHTVSLPLQTNTYSRQYLADISNRVTGQSLAYNPNLFLQSQGSGDTQTNQTGVLPYGPYTCVQGYVWREAFPNDYACVTPDVRTQAWADNAQASARVSPTGGAYGSDTCIQGYVWRGARAEDHVCVLPSVRDQTQSDNAQTGARRLSNQGPTSLNPSGVITLTADRSTIDSSQSNRTAVLTALVSNNPLLPTDQVRIRFVNENTNTIERTCEGTLTCTFTYTAALNAPSSDTVYRAELHNRATNVMIATPSRQKLTVQGGQTPLALNQLSLMANRQTFSSSDSDRLLRLTANVMNPSVATSDLEIRIYKRVVDHDRLHQRTCTGTAMCEFSAELYELGSEAWLHRYTYVAELRSRSTGQLLATSAALVITLNPQANGPFSQYSTQVHLAVTQRGFEGNDEAVRVKGYFTNPAPVGSYMIMVYDADTGELLADRGLWHEVETTVRGRAPQSRRLIARAQDFSGAMISSSVITIQFQGSAQPTFRVTSVSSMLDQSKPNRCSEGFGVIGTITANGPGTVSYKWERSDASTPPVQTITFDQAGTKTVSRDWWLSGNYSGWMRLVVIAPNEMVSNQTAIVSQCAPSPAFQVTNVSTSLDQSKANRCNEGFGAVATIATNAAGTVNYQWERSDGGISPIETITFSQAGSKTVSRDWNLTGTYSGWMRVKIISPNTITSNQTAIVSQCSAPQTLSGSVYTSVDPGEARAGQAVRIDALLTLQSSNGPVRVEIYNQDGQGLQTCWNMTSNAYCSASQAVIPADAQGMYSFYAQAIDGAGNVVRGNWFPVRLQ